LSGSLSIAGLVLAGGRSHRFGQDKALAQFGERTLLQLSLDRFAVCQLRAVAVRGEGPAAEHARDLGAAVVRDGPDTAEGPLAGIAAGLAWASANGSILVAIAPCDAPLLAWSHYGRLLDEMGKARAAFAITEEGEHPLCAIWRSSLLPTLSAAMSAGRHPPVQGFLRDIGAVKVAFADARDFVNTNTPGRLEQAAMEAGI
jgi:molybdopterin-guanine dinucleotide biosynthesis protein A